MVSTTHTCLCRAHRRKELRLGMGVLRFARLMLAVPVRSVIIICRTRDDDLQRHPGADADVQCSRSRRMILDPIYIPVLCIVLCFMLYHTYVNGLIQHALAFALIRGGFYPAREACLSLRMLVCFE